MIQPGDVTDMLYRPVAGDTAELQAQIKEITLPYKKLKEMRPEDKARLSKTSASMVPVAWSAGEGSPNLQIWSKTPKLTDLEISTIKARTPHFYGFPEGPAGKNMLSLRGSAQDKAEIALSNGYQTMMQEMFPMMDLVQRNSLVLQEHILAKTHMKERITSHENGVGLNTQDIAELQLQCFQTNMLVTHMRHTFHNVVGKQYQTATKMTGLIAAMHKNKKGDGNLGMGSSTEMRELKRVPS
jgi:hypothetical protein